MCRYVCMSGPRYMIGAGTAISFAMNSSKTTTELCLSLCLVFAELPEDSLAIRASARPLHLPRKPAATLTGSVHRYTYILKNDYLDKYEFYISCSLRMYMFIGKVGIVIYLLHFGGQLPFSPPSSFFPPLHSPPSLSPLLMPRLSLCVCR